MAAQQQPATHHLVRVGVAAPRFATRDALETGLPEDVPREDGPRLNPVALEMELEVAAAERRAVSDGDGEGQPRRPGVRILARENEPLLVGAEELQQGLEVVRATA